jgi:hypothetical protein
MKLQQTAINRRRLGERFTRAAALCVLALAAMVFRAQEARAQWSAPDAQGNTATTSAGRVGIGIATPDKGKLDVRTDDGVAAGEHGLIYASRTGATGGVYMGYRANGTAPTGGYLRGTANLPLFLGTNGTPESLIIANNGDVGIGVVPSKGKFHVQADLGATAGEHGLIYATRGGPGTGGVFMGYRADGATATGGFVRGTSNLPFFIGTTATPEAMTISDAGNVGFGTNAPASKLHVVGDITVTGNINAKYQDVAEWVPTNEKLAAGTVVVLDPKHSNHVLASTTSYDVRVAGVVSAQPGITLGEAGEGKALVATTGRVKVKVDATRAAVQIGDLLVTSDVPGVAMKSEPINIGGRQMHSPGTIIGKALEPLANGTGEILVLLSLQ